MYEIEGNKIYFEYTMTRRIESIIKKIFSLVLEPEKKVRFPFYQGQRFNFKPITSLIPMEKSLFVVVNHITY